MKILFKPFALIAGLIAARVGKSIFDGVWSNIDEHEPPHPTTQDASLTKVIGAATLEAATMAGVAAVADRGAAAVFHYLTGYWPGDKHEEPKED